MTRGPRFTGGYQFPATAAAGQLTRGEPIKRDAGADGRWCAIVPLLGAYRPQWDVCGQWTEADEHGQLHGVSSSYIATSEDEARREYAKLAREVLE